MIWLRRTRLTLLVGLLLAIAVLAWLLAHPGTYSGQLGRIITRNLLQESGAALTFDTLRGNPFSQLTFYEVSLTRSGEDGSFLYLRADSLSVEYDLGSFLAREPQLRSVVLGPSQLLAREGRPPLPGAEVSEETVSVRPEQRVDIDYLRIDSMDITVTDANGVAREEIDDLHWIGSMDTRLDRSLHLRASAFGARWTSRDLDLQRASFEARVRGRELRIDHATARLDTTDAELDLRLKWGAEGGVDELALEGTARDFVLSELLTLLGKDPGPRLRMSGAVRVRKDGDRLNVAGRAEGWLESYPVKTDQFRGAILPSGVRFEHVEGQFLGARGIVSGDLDFDREILRLGGVVSGADLSDPWTGDDLGWPETDLAGGLTLELDLKEPLRLELEATDLNGRFLELPVDSLSGDVTFDERDGVTIANSRAHVLGIALQGSGAVSPENQIEMAVRAQIEGLEDLASFYGLPLQGRQLVAAGRLHGSVEEPSLRIGGSAALLSSTGFEAVDNQFVVTLPVFHDLTRVEGELRSNFTEFRGLPTGSLFAQFRREGTRLELDPLEVVSSDSLLRARGVIDWSAEVPRVELDSLYVETGPDHWQLEEPTEISVLGRGFATPSLRLRSETGRVALEGRLDVDEEVDLSVQMQDADLQLLRRMGVLRQPVRGRADAVVRLEGRLDSLSAFFDVTLDSAWVASRSLGDARLRGRVARDRLDVEVFRARGPLGGLDVSGQIQAPHPDWPRRLVSDPASAVELWQRSRLDLHVETDRLASALLFDPTGPRARFGEATVSVSVRGTPLDPRLAGSVDVYGLETGTLTVPRMVMRLEADEEGLRLREGTLRTDAPWLSFSGQLPLDLSLAEAPRWKSDAGVELRVWSDGEVELAPFREFWPLARRLEGRGEILFEARGDPLDPTLTGYVRLREGELGMQGWSENLREIELEGSFEGDRLVVEEARAREGAKGSITGRGEVIFRGLLPDDVWADFEAERVLIASVPYLRAIATSDDVKLRLRRPSANAPRAPHITGSLVVDKAIYTGEFDTEGTGGGGALGPNLSPAWTAEIEVQARDQVRISNQSAELRVQGDIDFIRDTNGLRIRGIAEIPRGRVPLFNNDFTITEGSLDFSRRPVVPEVDITAVTEVPLYDETGGVGRELELITIHLTGTFGQPEVQFESESGLDENSILRLLAGFGGPQSETAVSAGVGDVGLRAGLNFLERALATRVEGVDTIDIETEEAGVEAMESTRIAVGKYISNDLYLRLSQGFSITEQDLFLEYQISRRLLFTSELGRRFRENGAQNEFNVDLKFRVRY